MEQPISLVIIGAGPRGTRAYIKNAPPGSIKIVAVAEPHKGRRENIQKMYSLTDEMCFESYTDLFKKERLADVALITTGDRMHIEPALAAVEKGYHILLEKPISPLYLVGSNCVKISSFGKLTVFKEENAPLGAAYRCTDGCPAYETCQYNAVKLYTKSELRNWVPEIFNVGDTATDEEIIKCLKVNQYGRCVYKCDNNVVDHQVVNIEFENGVTAAFTMCAFTKKNNRIIKLLGTNGEINADMSQGKITVYDFITGNTDVIEITNPTTGHGGGDAGIMSSFLNAIKGRGIDNTSAQVSVQSHMMAFAAEKSRLEARIVRLKEFINEQCE